MNWLRLLLRCARWVAGVWADFGLVACNAPVQHLVRAWVAYRRARRLREEWIRMWQAMPDEEQLGYIHPASDLKPPGWTIEKYIARLERERRDRAH